MCQDQGRVWGGCDLISHIYITIGKYEYYSVLREYPKVCVNFQTDVRLTSLEVYCMARNVYCIIKLAKNTRAGSQEIGPAQSN